MPPEHEHFDLIVIGSGPAGEKGAAQAAYFGKKVALIEKEPVLGGAAANTGTLPSKTLRETALYLSGFRNRDLYGLDVRLRTKATVRDLLAREHLIKETERSRIQQNLKRHHIALFAGEASFVDPHTIAVKPARCPELLIEGDYILLATGSYPFRPALFPFHDPRVYDSDTILDLHEIPPSMLVVGGGVIGCEYACMFAVMGVQVTVVEKHDRLIGSLDAELSESLRARMEAIGIRNLLGDVVDHVTEGDPIEVVMKSGTVVKVATILVSSGRCGNTEALALDRVGIVANDRGQIKVNASFQTNLPHVYAAGDVIGNPALASTSMDQARIAMVHAFDLKYRSGLAQILPYGIYTIPECSMAGETEESLTKKQIPYVVGRASYADNARGRIIGDTGGFLKLLFHEESLKLLGVHMIGEQATEVIHVGLTALLMEADGDLFIQTCYNYPTLTELYKYATYDAMGQRARRRAEAAQTDA
ncbi:MAG TPA: Si-specific NAD(P)(+) transhydrogenase [Isosphaeraceae bacterium]|jgi:NAD(P) transhydrogenase|nr:Si-specific NAD(P)(+) transhydrogenase [Isosphaeraceae bacterium]